MRAFSLPGILFLCLGFVALGCSSMAEMDETRATARRISLVAQGMTQGAENGARMHWNRIYAPTPNPYVGRLVFEQYCGRCHGDGKKIMRREGASVHDVESNYYVILYGETRNGKEMPSFRTRLTKFQVYDILSYLGFEVEEHLNDDYSGFRKE